MDSLPAPRPDDLLAIGHELVRRARRAGADIAEAIVGEGSELSVRVRLGTIEMLTEASHRSAGLRVLRDRHVAVTSTSDLTDAGIDRAVSDAIELLALSQEDPFAGPADPSLIASGPFGDLDLFDPALLEIDADDAAEAALRLEQAARDYDARVTNMDGASLSRVAGASAMVLSGGFASSRRATMLTAGATAIADDAGGKKRRGAWYETRRYRADLPSLPETGREAARRAVDMLGARKVPSCQAPVVFSQDAARAIVALFASGLIGTSIWKRSSYLVGREGTRVASPQIDLVDDPFVRRGFGSRAHDGEGLLSRVNSIVERGVLRTYLCDSYAGRKLGTASTASASRGGGGTVGPSSTNLVLRSASVVPEADLIAGTARGLLVNQMMGYGFNPTTGDFSRGASGFWIEQGRIAFPVSEVTISRNLDALLQDIDLVGNRADLRSSIVTPAFRVASMTISGA